MSGTNVVGALAVTGCGVVSAAGLGLSRMADALGGRLLPCADPGELPVDEPLPEPIRVVPAFRAAELLGKKGTRNLDRTTALGLVACDQALADAGGRTPDRGGSGVVIATTTGSARSIGEFARDTLVRERPYLVDPRAFPNTVMNCCAGQVAMRNSLRGVNATVAGGHAASLLAFRYARNALRQGHADRLVVGGVEELCPQSAWAWRATHALARDTPIGEGAALFVVEDWAAAHRRSATVLAELLACEVAFAGPALRRASVTESLSGCVARALARSGVTAEEVDVVATGGGGLRVAGRLEGRAVETALHGRAVRQIRAADVVGETFSAGAAFGVAALLAGWRTAGNTRAEVGLVTSVGLDGNVGCLVVRDHG